MRWNFKGNHVEHAIRKKNEWEKFLVEFVSSFHAENCLNFSRTFKTEQRALSYAEYRQLKFNVQHPNWSFELVKWDEIFFVAPALVHLRVFTTRSSCSESSLFFSISYSNFISPCPSAEYEKVSSSLSMLISNGSSDVYCFSLFSTKCNFLLFFSLLAPAHGSSESQCSSFCSTVSRWECFNPAWTTNVKKIAVKYCR